MNYRGKIMDETGSNPEVSSFGMNLDQVGCAQGEPIPYALGDELAIGIIEAEGEQRQGINRQFLDAVLFHANPVASCERVVAHSAQLGGAVEMMAGDDLAVLKREKLSPRQKRVTLSKRITLRKSCSQL